ncbi:MAG: hypothetical protein HYX35_01760, partial [Proteobacteria bacterium]|nr:hypothetical protein [Pseudomonadota bacterium]
MIHSSVLFTCSVVALGAVLGSHPTWAMEEDLNNNIKSHISQSSDSKHLQELTNGLDELQRTNFLKSNNEKLSWEERMDAALKLSDRGVALLTEWANDEKLGWKERMFAAINLPDKGVAFLTKWAHEPTLDWKDRRDAAINLPDKGVALLTEWANNEKLGWEVRRIAVHNLPDKGVAFLTKWAHEPTLDWKERMLAAHDLPDKGVAFFTEWANNEKLGWKERRDAAINLSDKGVALLTKWANESTLDWKERRNAVHNLPDRGVAFLTKWANNASTHPRLRLEGIQRLDDQESKNRLYLEIFSNESILMDCRLIAYLRINNCTPIQSRLLEKVLGKILQETRKSFFDTIKNLSEEIPKEQKELLEKLLKQKNLNQKDKDAIQEALTQLNKKSVTPSSNNNNTSTSTSTSTSTVKSLSSSKRSLIGNLLAASRRSEAVSTAPVPTTQGSSAQASNPPISEGKQEVNPPGESKGKKSKKKSMSSKQLTPEEIAALEAKKDRIRADEEEKAKREKEERVRWHPERAHSDASSEDETSTDSSLSDMEYEGSSSKAKKKEVTALIRRAAMREVVDAQKVGQMPNTLEFVQKVLSQTMPGVAPIMVQKLVQTADNALNKAKRVLRLSNPSNNNNQRMERDEENYTVRSVNAFDISSCTFHSPEAARMKYEELEKAFLKEGPFPSIGKAEQLKNTVTMRKMRETFQCYLYSLRLSDSDRLIYTFVGRTIIRLAAGDHKAVYDRYVANTNNIT